MFHVSGCVNNLFGCVMSRNLSLDSFEWRKDKFAFNKEFIKNYDEDSDKRYMLEVDVNYQKELHKLHRDTLFLSERMKIDKCQNLVCNLYI